MPGIRNYVGQLFFISDKRSTFAASIRRNIMMKKINLVYALLVILAACGGKSTPSTRISGEIKGLGNDTLYLFGADPLYDRMDTLPVKEGKFSADLSVDTLVTAYLLFGDGNRYPIFVGKGDNILVKGNAGDLTSIEVTGNTANDEFTTFQKDLKGLGKPSERALQEKAETFITTHPASLASVYLLEQYFVKTTQPDLYRIERLIGRMTGELKDRPNVDQLSKRIQNEEKTVVGKTLPYFRLPDTEGKETTRTDFKDQYLLLHFWASWDSLSMKQNEMYKRIYQKVQKNKNFALLGISLDTDRKAWLDVIEQDTLKWKQLCDFDGWHSAFIGQLSLHNLPANILVSPSARIEGKDLDEDAILKKVEDIDQEAKEKKAQARKRR